jgi:hypothetical protein
MWKFGIVHCGWQVEFLSEHKGKNAIWLTHIAPHILGTVAAKCMHNAQIMHNMVQKLSKSKLVFVADQLSC